MMSLTLYLCRKNTFPGQMRCIFFSVSPRDREFPKTGHKMLAKWGIRLPNQFLSHNTLLQSKNQAKVAYFTKLMILIFGCPEEIRITNFTRMPQEQHCNIYVHTCVWQSSHFPWYYGRSKSLRWLPISIILPQISIILPQISIILPHHHLQRGRPGGQCSVLSLLYTVKFTV